MVILSAPNRAQDCAECNLFRWPTNATVGAITHEAFLLVGPHGDVIKFKIRFNVINNSMN
jgi:hypothetical protein